MEGLRELLLMVRRDCRVTGSRRNGPLNIRGAPYGLRIPRCARDLCRIAEEFGLNGGSSLVDAADIRREQYKGDLPMASVVPEVGPDETKIDPLADLDVEFWAAILDAFPMQITHAASIVGSSVHRVQRYLQAHGAATGSTCH